MYELDKVSWRDDILDNVEYDEEPDIKPYKMIRYLRNFNYLYRFKGGWQKIHYVNEGLDVSAITIHKLHNKRKYLQ